MQAREDARVGPRPRAAARGIKFFTDPPSSAPPSPICGLGRRNNGSFPHSHTHSIPSTTPQVGPVPERILAPITARVLRALGALHGRRLLHRDIKPANVLLTRAGDPRVADFGISATIPDATLAACHTFTGTVTYMSPERVDGLPYGLPSDVWALGLTLLEAVTGRYPYDASAGVMQLMVQVGQGSK